MKLILSRKGFDSSAGGCPSPILPDGRLLSLPIPDARSTVLYRDIRHPDVPVGRLVSQLTRQRWRSGDGAHLDPDLVAAQYPRAPGWRPLLGQTGSAQGHLAAQQVAPGDVFLFFGLFRPVQLRQRRWRFVPGSRPRHVLWGWLQIAEIITVDALAPEALPWARYHPHFRRDPEPNNTLYLATDALHCHGRSTGLPGAGVFPRAGPDLWLTRPEARLPGQWRLPAACHPETGREPLSYHHRAERWQRRDAAHCHLQAVSRGQEFVFREADDLLRDWVHPLLAAHSAG